MQYSNIDTEFFQIIKDFSEISVRYDAQHRAVWCYHNPNPRPVFSTRMLTELRIVQKGMMAYYERKDPREEPLIRYLIILSKVPGIFSMGGDLSLFSKLIKEKDRQQLLDYANQCIEVLYFNSVSMNLPVTTISLVEGQAFGGGFECALSSNILIATDNSEMGFPEIKFNLFPGMGAYQFISRSCGIKVAEKMISTGNAYSAAELHDMGVVDFVCEERRAIEFVEELMRKYREKANFHEVLRAARRTYHPIEYEELGKVAELWADTALGLEERDLKLIDRLVKAQSHKMSEEINIARKRTRQDRRFTDSKRAFPLVDSSGESVESDRRKSSDRRS